MKNFFLKVLQRVGLGVFDILPERWKGYRTIATAVIVFLIGFAAFLLESLPGLCDVGINFTCENGRFYGAILMISGTLQTIIRTITDGPVPDLKISDEIKQ